MDNMIRNSLETFADGIRLNWGSLTSELIASCKARVEELARTPPAEGWLAGLRKDLPESRELYRDPAHGFVLLAHAESRGRYRAPHDHGRGWVIYAVQQGEMEITTYAPVFHPDDKRVRLVRREAYRLRPGEAKVYLPGDIHDTRCTSDTVLYFRFTDRDLKKEEREGHRVTRYVERNGLWIVDAA
jgi:hypothetical protein